MQFHGNGYERLGPGVIRLMPVGVGCSVGGPILTVQATQDEWPSVVEGCEWGGCSCACHRPWELMVVAIGRL